MSRRRRIYKPRKKPTSRGTIARVLRDYGAGGVGYIQDINGYSVFFHRRHVTDGSFQHLEPGCAVEYQLIKPRRAMGAGAQARNVRLVSPYKIASGE